jgi:hypothetical protein
MFAGSTPQRIGRAIAEEMAEMCLFFQGGGIEVELTIWVAKNIVG